MGFLVGKRASPQTNNRQAVAQIIDLLSAGYSIFNINRRLVDIPEVRTAVNMVAETISTVPFYHSREKPVEGKFKKVNVIDDSFNRVLKIRANKFQTSQTFITNVISRLMYNNNVFCMPVWDLYSAGLKEVYPLPVTQFEFVEEKGVQCIYFPEISSTFLYSDIIHLQRFPDIKNGIKTQAIYNYTDVVSAMQAASIKQLEASGKIKALLISKAGLKDADMAKQLERFKQTYLTSENVTGFGMINGNYELVPFDMNLQSIDISTMQELIKGIYGYFNVSTNIINRTASELEYQQYVNGLEPTLEQIAQEFTYKLFSDAEISSGNRIAYDLLHLEISTLTAKSMFLDKAIYQGSMTRNEARQYIGLDWIDGGDELITNKNAQNIQEVNAGGKKDDSNPESS